MLTDKEATSLGKALSEMIRERGLGALSKKDYEPLVFHHLSHTRLSTQAHDVNWVFKGN